MFGFFKKRSTQINPRPAEAGPRFVRACHLYCRPESDQVIVASVFNHEGATAEKPGGSTVTKLSDTTTLNEVIRVALTSCEYQPEFNYSQQKLTDWPAYQMSGYKTVKGFEASFIRLHVRGVNDANLFYEVSSPEFGDFGLHLAVIVNAHKGNHGEAVQYLVNQYLICLAAVGAKCE